MSFIDPQNNPDFNKPKRKMDYPIRYDETPRELRERGGCLTAFLVVYGLLGVVTLWALNSLSSEINQSVFSSSTRSQLQCITWLTMAGVFGQLICIAGLWNFKRWGYHGLLGLMGIVVVLNLCSGDLLQVITNGVVVAILVYLVNPIQHVLE